MESTCHVEYTCQRESRIMRNSSPCSRRREENYALEQRLSKENREKLAEFAERETWCDQQEEETRRDLVWYTGDSGKKRLQLIDQLRRKNRDARAKYKDTYKNITEVVGQNLQVGREKIEGSIPFLEQRLAHLKVSPPCSACKLYSDYSVCLFGDPIKDGQSRLTVAEFCESRKAGCGGCGMVLDAIEACRPGWLETHAADGEIHITVNGKVLAGNLLSPETDTHYFMVLQSQGQYALVLFIAVCTARDKSAKRHPNVTHMAMRLGTNLGSATSMIH
ncbi:hypothetical protein F5884DRAFT_471886 [Xylogone sp. PMI_703]|nr:hypothetical protein F5884DRAFT_471886 [Xylogone sp. PMI_703]